MTLLDLSRILGTSRTKLSELIRIKGFSSFPAYLNTYRLKEFIHIMNSKDDETITSASIRAGFGSKTSFYRLFTGTYGVSPTEYLNK